MDSVCAGGLVILFFCKNKTGYAVVLCDCSSGVFSSDGGVRDVLFFFFKQNTAYEFGTGVWSSDVCSSDLIEGSSVGELTGENHGANKKTSKVFDMTVTEDQLLIVTQSANSSIEYYQLHY